MHKLVSSAMFINAVPVCKKRNRAIVHKISLKAIEIPTMKKGYLYACCQTENGAYVYQGDYIRTNQGNLYRVLSLYVHYFHGEGTVFVYVSDLATRNRASVPLNEIHGLCDFASEDSLIGKKVSIISGKGAELDRE